MPANLVPHAAIPDLAARVTPDMLKVLRRVQDAGSIANGKGVDPETVVILGKLAGLALISTVPN